MELTMFTTYLILKLSSISVVTFIITLIFTVLYMFGLCSIDRYNKVEEMLDDNKNRFLRMAIIAGVLWIITPTTKQIATIYIIPKIANHEVVQQLPDEMANLAMEWLKELKPSNNSE